MFIGAEAYRFTAGRGLGKTENILEILACVNPCVNHTFTSLETMLTRHLADISGLICVLLSWDDKRMNLVKYIRSRNIPLLVFLISDNNGDQWDVSSVGINPDCIIILHPGRIQDQLDQVRIPDEIT
jgi:hypothetical protein